MSKPLIIVESNAKCKKISQITGCTCVASFGHIMQLKPSLDWFDPNNIQVEYVVLSDKKKVIKQLKDKAKNAQRVIIASDMDREGEAIAAHLMQILKLDPDKTDRIVFNQITTESITYAMEHPQRLNLELFNSQKTRSIIDLVFGFKLSPYVSKILKK